VLGSPREIPSPRPASSWKTVWWSRSDEQAKRQPAGGILAQRQSHLDHQVQTSSQGCGLQGYQERYRVSGSLRCGVFSPAAWAGLAKARLVVVHTPQKAESRRPRNTRMVGCAQQPDFQPDCESSSWVVMTDAADTALVVDLADSNPQVFADMASSSFRARRKSAAAVVANTAKEQTGRDSCQEEIAGASWPHKRRSCQAAGPHSATAASEDTAAAAAAAAATTSAATFGVS
jgi:hypothetical protein